MKQKILFNKTKIVATVGPACNTPEKLEALVKSGVDVFRLNFSHGDYETHRKVIQQINDINEKLGTHVTILQDLQGPKIRIGEVEYNNIEIKKGHELIITTAEELVGNAKKVSTTYENLHKDVQTGDIILIDDGKLEFEVIGINGKEVKVKAKNPGTLKSKKGINLPFTKVSAPSMTEKDLEDLQFGLKNGVQWVALSFVRHKKDITELRKIIKNKGLDTRIIAKIEKPEAIENIDEIIEESDGVMVARGDLGVELPMEKVPLLQKRIVRKCNEACKPVIIATQMMESMIENPRPTRAETNDVANAVMDGADAVMLSAETAAGKYPLEVVKSMVKTIEAAEESSKIYHKFGHVTEENDTFLNDSVVQTACRLAETVNAKALVGMTKSGYTAFKLASHRPTASIFIFTANKPLLKIINLVWGVRGFYYDKMTTTDETFADIESVLKENKHLKKGDIMITTASMPIMEKNRTNMLKLKVVE